MQTIYKYILDLSSRAVRMPANASIISIANQHDEICIWAIVDTEQKQFEERHFEIFGTGHPIHADMGVTRKFIGTVLMSPYVWHVFERV